MTAEDFEVARRELLAIADSLSGQQARLSIVDADPPHSRLSRREREVMSMMLEGQRLKEIAARLDISVKTVTTHRSRLMKKLHVEDNLGLYRYGIRNGLISV
jgi:DNA-binding NarL/FixJ family response regulator